LLAEIDDLGRSRYASGSRMVNLGVRSFEAVLDQQVEIVALVKHFALNVRMVLSEKPHLSVLLRHELLTHRRDLYVDVILREVEVRPEVSDWISVVIPFESECVWLVFPVDSVEIQQPRKFLFAVVGELSEIGRGWPEEVLCSQIPDAPACFSPRSGPNSWSGKSLCNSPRTSS
jgi:hypothetical protein